MIVLIDGPSGAGKSVFATRLREILGWELVQMDDLYPGWEGLREGSDIVVRDVLNKRGYFRWDWERHQRGLWRNLKGEHLIIEGVGALTPDTLAAARAQAPVLSMVFDGPESWRRQRALNRDPGYEDYWQMWARQEREHFPSMPTPDVYWWMGRPSSLRV